MWNRTVLSRTMLTAAFLMVVNVSQAGPNEDAALAQAKRDYEAAMKGSDVGLQNVKRIQLGVLTAKAEASHQQVAQADTPVEMPPLAHELNCVACHAIDHRVVGPAWRDVANRYTGSGVTTYTYQGKVYPLLDGLVMKVSKGGGGNWGTMPMPANDPTGVKREKIIELLKFEQSLAKR